MTDTLTKRPAGDALAGPPGDLSKRRAGGEPIPCKRHRRIRCADCAKAGARG